MIGSEFYFTDELQDLLLACMIRHPEKFEAVGQIVLPEYFWGVQSMIVCQCLQDYMSEEGHYPTFEFLSDYVFDHYGRDQHDKAKEAYAFVKRLEQMDTRDVDSVVKKAIRFAKERALINAVRDAASAIKTGEWPEEGFCPMFEKAMRVGENILDIGYSAYDDAEDIIDLVTSQTYGIRTRFKPLDDIWYNGWAPGWLIVPLAPPKSYKTTFSINLALNMVSAIGSEEPIDVFYYACEISSELMLTRAYASLTGKSMSEIYKMPKQFKATLRRTLEMKMGGRMIAKFFAAKTATIADIKAHAKMAIAHTGVQPKAIFIDHAETIRPALTGKNVSDWRQQADIYTEARAMGAELGCTIIMPDRCNRETVERKTPNLTSFQGSFEKGGVVDVAIGLCQTPEERVENKMRYFVFVNRHGPQYVLMEGTIEPEKMRMTIDDTVHWKPDSDDPKGNQLVKKSGRKKIGDNVAQQPTLPDELKDEDER